MDVVSQMSNFWYADAGHIHPEADSKDVLHVFVYLITVSMFCLQTSILLHNPVLYDDE